MAKRSTIIGVLGAVALGVGTAVIGAVANWPTIEQWVVSFVKREEPIRWRGRSVGELVSLIEGRRFDHDLQLRLAPNTDISDLNSLLVSRGAVPRTFVATSMRGILDRVCQENNSCLSCAWTADGGAMAIEVLSSCVEPATDGSYYVCKRRC